MRSSAMCLLALDTSTRTVGLALYDGVQVLSEAAWTSQDYHTVELAPAVWDAFQKTGIGMDHLGAIGVAIGPGSFTGLRVGLALAKGLALACHLPLVGVSTLDVLAAAQPLSELNMAAVLRAGRGRLAVGWYRVSGQTWQRVENIEVLTPGDLVVKIHSATLVCGELNEAERDLLRRQQPLACLASPARSLRRPAFLAEMAWTRWKAGQTDDPTGLSPVYLHYNDPIPG
jgi:tRNA threonylcarbamoyladenosine biosynthesis protein TsaB